MACDHYKDWTFQIHWKSWNMSCLLNVTKNKPSCTSSEKLFKKNENIDNFWVGHSVMKPVDSK